MPRPCLCDRCQLCWLYLNDPAYRALWDGTTAPPAVRPAVVRHPLPCLHLGKIVVRAPCLCPRRDVRHCDQGHGDVRQAEQCETCADYESDDVP